KGFLPAIGTLHHLEFPQGPGIRVETGVRQGDAISPYYDPMIAKLISHGDDRETALDVLYDALAGTRIAGSVVNTAFLAALICDEDFAAGNVDTGLIERKQAELTTATVPTARELAAAAVTAADIASPMTMTD